MEYSTLEKERPLPTAEPDVSVVIPLFNEMDNIMALFSALRSVMEKLERTWEMVFVDDGSTDATYQVLRRLLARDKAVCVVRLRRNFGQTAALAAGLLQARGNIIVTMDGDLQNDPLDIPLLISKVEEGYDVATGWRINRQDPFLSRRFPSKIANWLISFITGVRLHDYGCTLRALRRDIAKELRLYGEMHRFIPTLAADLGATIVELPVRHHPRRHGSSKYGLSRTIRVLLDLLTVKFLSQYSTRPSHMFGLFGVLAMLGGSATTVYLAFQKIFHQASLGDRPLLLFGILFIIIGVQFITMGLLGEMLFRSSDGGQEKLTYPIKEVLRSEGVVAHQNAKPVHHSDITRVVSNLR
jgi:glycosyltransferase involved in cell wall biosynthesis